MFKDGGDRPPQLQENSLCRSLRRRALIVREAETAWGQGQVLLTTFSLDQTHATFEKGFTSSSGFNLLL